MDILVSHILEPRGIQWYKMELKHVLHAQGLFKALSNVGLGQSNYQAKGFVDPCFSVTNSDSFTF